MTRNLFRLIEPRINDRVLKIIHERLTDEQLGLLLVKMINPYIVFSQQEEAKLRGIDRKTLRGMKARGELANLDETVNPQDAPKRPKSGPKYPASPHPGKP